MCSFLPLSDRFILPALHFEDSCIIPNPHSQVFCFYSYLLIMYSPQFEIFWDLSSLNSSQQFFLENDSHIPTYLLVCMGTRYLHNVSIRVPIPKLCMAVTALQVMGPRLPQCRG